VAQGVEYNALSSNSTTAKKKKKIKETIPDKLLTLIEVRCLQARIKAPMIQKHDKLL
jgi:NADH:ubiquinone oxidoreductase subunit E